MAPFLGPENGPILCCAGGAPNRSTRTASWTHFWGPENGLILCTAGGVSAPFGALSSQPTCPCLVRPSRAEETPPRPALPLDPSAAPRHGTTR